MEVTKEQKDKIEAMIVSTAIDALEAGAITEDTLKPIADFVLGKIDEIKTDAELMQFLKELEEKWPFFTPVEKFMQGQLQQAGEKISIDEAQGLIKSGQIDEALQVLKAADTGGQTI